MKTTATRYQQIARPQVAGKNPRLGTGILRSALGLLTAAALFTGCGKEDYDPEAEPTLSIWPALETISFDADGTGSFTFEVTTNQPIWLPYADQDWCKITLDADKSTFTVSALPNLSETPPAPATITVTAGKAAPVTFTATQAGARYEVYVAGSYRPGDSGNHVACCWRDGEFFQLPVPAGYESDTAISVAADNGSVYVFGRYKIDDEMYRGLWKDWEFVELEIDQQFNALDAFTVSGGSVYFGGQTLFNGVVKVCYWKDGVLKTFDQPAAEVECGVTCIGVLGDKVVLGGLYLDEHWSPCVCYWMDDKFTPLGEPGGALNEAVGTVISNGRVCVLGPQVGGKVQLWIDDRKQEYDFPMGADDDRSVSLCTAPDGSVYLLGEYELNGTGNACWWDEKGTCTELEKAHSVSGIAAVDGSVYVAGLHTDRKTPCYWKDGERVDLPVPDNTSEVEVAGICVVKK